MYQSIYYSHSGEDKNTCYLRDSVKGWQQFKYYPPVYKLDPYGEFTTLFGDKCSQVFGKWDWNDPTILEKDIQKELAVLRDLYYESDEIPTYHNAIYLDIEIEILGALTPQTIREANAKITSIALIDVNTKKKYCWIINNNIQSLDKDNKQIISCKNEKQLLSSFLDKWIELDPTIVCSYNGDFFDIPYLYFRMKKILGDDMVLYLSPIKKINDSVYNSYSPITLGGINSLDYMLLIKKYIMKEEPSYKLGDIGLKYANLGKIEYNGNLDKLFVEDPVKFIEYNLRDVEIIEKLEEKLQFIKLTILICHLCHVPYESIYYNTILNEGAILTYLKRKNIVSPNKPTTTNKSIKELIVGDEVIHQRGTPTVEGVITYIDEKSQRAQIQTKSNTLKERSLRTIRKKEGYSGGFLLDPKPGLYKWLYDEDVTSMYPFIMISLNMGVETLVGRMVIDNPNYNCWNSFLEMEEMVLENPTKIVEVEILNKKTFTLNKKTINIKKLVDFIKENNLVVSANGVFFSTDRKSAVSEILENGFNIRKKYKDKMKEAHKIGDVENQILYQNYQMVYKIFINGNYGTNGINSYRFTDGYKIIASAITTTGQRIIQESIKYLNEEIKKEINS
jgi:DNA polymerase elongation subunit (family B)